MKNYKARIVVNKLLEFDMEDNVRPGSPEDPWRQGNLGPLPKLSFSASPEYRKAWQPNPDPSENDFSDIGHGKEIPIPLEDDPNLPTADIDCGPRDPSKQNRRRPKKDKEKEPENKEKSQQKKDEPPQHPRFKWQPPKE